MSAGGSGGRSGLRYQPDERPPAALAIGLGLQIAVLTIAAIILVPTIVMRAAGASEAYLSWAVFATVAICGVTTILQSVRAGRIGAGHLVVMGASAAFISVCIAAVSAGGPALLRTLVVVSSFIPLVLSARLSLFQRVFTASGLQGRQRGGSRVCRGVPRRECPGSACSARRRARRGAGRGGGVAPAVAPARVLRSPSAVSRHGCRDGPRGSAGAGWWRGDMTVSHGW